MHIWFNLYTPQCPYNNGVSGNDLFIYAFHWPTKLTYLESPPSIIWGTVRCDHRSEEIELASKVKMSITKITVCHSSEGCVSDFTVIHSYSWQVVYFVVTSAEPESIILIWCMFDSERSVINFRVFIFLVAGELGNHSNRRRYEWRTFVHRVRVKDQCVVSAL